MIDLDTEEKVVAVAPASSETNGSDEGAPAETAPPSEGQIN
jgi:hypothetical protein